jgi:hypothetical protein
MSLEGEKEARREETEERISGAKEGVDKEDSEGAFNL